MHYVTIFDASTNPFRNLSFLLVGIGLSAVGALLVFAPEFLEKYGFWKVRQRRLFSWFYFSFAVLWTIIAGSSIIGGALSASNAAKNKKCETVEGRVENFHPMPASGHDTERFEVRGVLFEYSDYIMTPGFNNASSLGGPIREGLLVRICHRDGQILRLEIAR